MVDYAPSPMSTSPRLCIDVSNTLEAASLSGIQRVTLELRAALAASADLVTLDGRSGRFAEVRRSQRQRLERLRSASHNRSISQRIEARAVRSLPSARPTFEFRHDDVLLDIEASWHAPMPRAALLPTLESPSAALIHDVLPITNPEWFPSASCDRFASWFEAHVAARSTLLAVSEATADAVTTLGVERPAVIRIGQPPSPPMHPGTGILMIGTIEPRKGHALVLDALDLLGDEAPVVDVVGRPGWDTKTLSDRLEGHPKIRWHQGVSDLDLDALWQRSGLLLQPSLGEGFGLPVVEALHRRIAVMSSDIPVMREVGRGETTMLRLDAAAWAERLASYADDPAAWPRPQPLDWPSWTDSASDTLHALTTAGVWPDPGSTSR